MTESDPPLPQAQDSELETNAQVDPYLSEGRVGSLRVIAFGLAGAAILALVLWGLNAPSRREAGTSAGGTTTGATTSASPKPVPAGAPATGRADSSTTGPEGTSPSSSAQATNPGQTGH